MKYGGSLWALIRHTSTVALFGDCGGEEGRGKERVNEGRGGGGERKEGVGRGRERNGG